jgi:hypothetical protein
MASIARDAMPALTHDNSATVLQCASTGQTDRDDQRHDHAIGGRETRRHEVHGNSGKRQQPMHDHPGRHEIEAHDLGADCDGGPTDRDRQHQAVERMPQSPKRERGDHQHCCADDALGETPVEEQRAAIGRCERADHVDGA